MLPLSAQIKEFKTSIPQVNPRRQYCKLQELKLEGLNSGDPNLHSESET